MRAPIASPRSVFNQYPSGKNSVLTPRKDRSRSVDDVLNAGVQNKFTFVANQLDGFEKQNGTGKSILKLFKCFLLVFCCDFELSY